MSEALILNSSQLTSTGVHLGKSAGEVDSSEAYKYERKAEQEEHKIRAERGSRLVWCDEERQRGKKNRKKNNELFSSLVCWTADKKDQ